MARSNRSWASRSATSYRSKTRIKVDHQLALDLYDTGISDAMYLAGLIADDPKMTRDDLQRWVEGASWSLISESTVPWVAVGGLHGWDMALRWIDHDSATIAGSGWSTLSSLDGITNDANLDFPALENLLRCVTGDIHGERNRVRQSMNGFVICVGGHVAPLTETDLRTADEIGPVTVDVGTTACKVPSARAYIEKMRVRGNLGKKRKSAKC